MNGIHTKLCALLMVALGVFISSCRSVPEHRDRVEMPYERLAIVQFADEPPFNDIGERFTDLLAEKISQVEANVDPIIIKPGDIGMEDVSQLLQRGAIPLEILRQTAQEYHADAIMIGKMTHFDAYSDPEVGITLKVFDVADATLISSTNRHWEAAAPEVREDIEEYYEENRSRSECRFGPNLMTTSPRYFLFFVAHQVVKQDLGQVESD